uniref:Uncharacterized protein n=1 Tax=Arundo donax TaxID=35708 RepID=A0A0A9ECL5_ARUDO
METVKGHMLGTSEFTEETTCQGQIIS